MLNTINSKNIDQRLCNTIINQNMQQSSVGIYKECPNANSLKFNFVEYEPEVGTHVCNVSIFNKHPIDIIFELSDTGLNIPCQTILLNPMGLNFDGINIESSEGIYDPNIFLRTNYGHLIKKNSNIFLSKNDTDVIYTKNVTIIRDGNYKFMGLHNVVLMGVVMLFPPNDIQFIKNKENKHVLNSTTFLKLQMIIESAFQLCICDTYSVVVVSIYPIENIPIDDQLLIYNYCILKYGHKFKNIIFGIQTNDIQMFNYIDSNMMKPQDITKDIDSKYETEIMKNKFKLK